jgi:hypothetical protein
MKFFDYKPEETTCHSGGAEGADTIWETFATLYGLKVKAWSYKTKYHKSPYKAEVSEDDYKEGIEKIKKANKILGRQNIEKHMSLLARNWAQVKYSEEIFAIGRIVKEGDTSSKGFVVKSKSPTVDGGTGYAVQMGIQAGKTVYVFDQKKEKWFKWSYIIDDFIECKTPIIQTDNFAGIGTREINPAGEKAIEDVYIKSYKIQ